MVLLPSFWDFKWYSGIFPGALRGIQGLLQRHARMLLWPSFVRVQVACMSFICFRPWCPISGHLAESQVLFKVLFPGILSGIHSGPEAKTGPEWFCGPLSGISSGIQGLFPGILSGIQGLVNGIVALFPQSSAGMQGLFLGILSGIQGLLQRKPEWYCCPPSSEFRWYV